MFDKSGVKIHIRSFNDISGSFGPEKTIYVKLQCFFLF